MDKQKAYIFYKRWSGMAERYREELIGSNTGYLELMVDLIQAIARTDVSKTTSPSTSHESLVIRPHLGFDPDKPFASVSLDSQGCFKLTYWASVGNKKREIDSPDYEVIVKDLSDSIPGLSQW